MFTDDGKEAALDDLFGLKTWWEDDYRWMGYGTCCFNNESFERASGQDAIPSGQECSYPVESSMLNSPEDSFLSREIGKRVKVSCTRRDQAVEIEAFVNVPGDIPVGTPVREFAIFCGAHGPYQDPSNFDSQKKYVMICRQSHVGTGYYQCVGGMSIPCGSGASGATLCYKDEPWIATGDRKLHMFFTEM